MFVFESSLNLYIQFGQDNFFPTQFDMIFHLVKVSDLDYSMVLRKAPPEVHIFVKILGSKNEDFWVEK